MKNAHVCTGKKRGRWYGVCVAALVGGALAAGILAGAPLLAQWQLSRQKPVSVAAPVEEPESSSQPALTPEEQEEAAQRARFADLLEENPDVVGWITIPDTPVDLPVMQTDDNSYYLSHGLDSSSDKLGLPYVDYECDVKSGQHLIVYGHNMGKNRTERFSSLQHYMDADYCREHPVIQLDTLYTSQTYKIVAVYVISAELTDADVFYFNQYIQFADDADWQAYLDEIAARALYTVDGFTRPGERLLSLCTCIHTISNARLIVVARPLREGESTQAQQITINSDPLMPARWPKG